MIKLLFDANISYRIKKKVDSYFGELLHVTDTNLPVPAKDSEIWEWAKKNNYLIVSYDEDFESLVA
jgi:predicted nuclease of predicted toxin-antitoxin system